MEHDGALPPAGWFTDPESPGQQRWWDGTTWTEHRRAPGADAPPPSAGGAADWQGGTGHAPPSWAVGSPSSPEGQLNALAVASLVASLVWMGGLSSIAAIVLGVLAKKEIDASGGHQRGDGLATAGIVLGIIGIVLPLLAVIGGFLFLIPMRAL